MGPFAAKENSKVRPPLAFKKAAKAGQSRYHFGASRIDCEVRRRMSAFGGKADIGIGHAAIKKLTLRKVRIGY